MTEGPKRIQLSRRRGWRMPPNTIKVDRSTGYGNPFVIGEVPPPAFAAYSTTKVVDAAEAVALYRKLMIRNLATSDNVVDQLLKLRGKNLACWCRPGSPCHADVLLEFANLDV